MDIIQKVLIKVLYIYIYIKLIYIYTYIYLYYIYIYIYIYIYTYILLFPYLDGYVHKGYASYRFCFDNNEKYPS